MNRQFYFESKPDKYGFEAEGGEWEQETDRGSAPYIRWVQQSLNRVLGLRLAVDLRRRRSDPQRDPRFSAAARVGCRWHCRPATVWPHVHIQVGFKDGVARSPKVDPTIMIY